MTQTFVDTEWGRFNAHHYRYTADLSTFIVECERDTWLKAGFADTDEDAARTRCKAIFSETLDGADLVSNRSIWRNFPRLWVDRWSHRNRVLLGDALHTAHFSIGSGTRLALEDAIALVQALGEAPHLEVALQTYEDMRKPIARKLVMPPTPAHSGTKPSASGWNSNPWTSDTTTSPGPEGSTAHACAGSRRVSPPVTTAAIRRVQDHDDTGRPPHSRSFGRTFNRK